MLHTHEVTIHDDAGRVAVDVDGDPETSYGYSDSNSQRFARQLAEKRARALADDLRCDWKADY